MKRIAFAAAGVLLATGQIPDLAAKTVPQKRESTMKEVAVLSIVRQGVFYVGGSYYKQGNATFMQGQMFVQYQIPAHLRHPYPIVFLHGQGQSGVNFLTTPDGRPGWADYFLRRGYATYVVDQAMRGRSTYNASVDGTLSHSSVQRVEQQFTVAPPPVGSEPGVAHSQWPGSGLPGDDAFDQFYASQLGSTDSDDRRMDALNRDAGGALLDRIGPAILLTHSRAGPLGWLIADARPGLVKAIVAVEPAGPPFGIQRGKAPAKPWGLSIEKLTYTPLALRPEDLSPVQETAPRGPGQTPCWTLGIPRKLSNLTRIPVAVITGEASYHRQFDHCTVEFLTAAGVKNDWLKLEDHGLHGNGHMMMLEKNSDAIAHVIDGWLESHGN